MSGVWYFLVFFFYLECVGIIITRNPSSFPLFFFQVLRFPRDFWSVTDRVRRLCRNGSCGLWSLPRCKVQHTTPTLRNWKNMRKRTTPSSYFISRSLPLSLSLPFSAHQGQLKTRRRKREIRNTWPGETPSLLSSCALRVLIVKETVVTWKRKKKDLFFSFFFFFLWLEGIPTNNPGMLLLLLLVRSVPPLFSSFNFPPLGEKREKVKQCSRVALLIFFFLRFLWSLLQLGPRRFRWNKWHLFFFFCSFFFSLSVFEERKKTTPTSS